ncbi:MAG: flagellar hook-length control protein FliK [Methylococcaceae bacterium]|nr:flagellar hook-length control protein FliK [Methylococcaceae bacterium]
MTKKNNPPLTSSSSTLPPNLKLNQKLNVQVIKNNLDTKTLTFRISPSNFSVQVQSNLAFKTKQGENLQLLVSKLTPLAEFKIIANDADTKTTNLNLDQQTEKPINLKDILLKQLISNISKTTESLAISGKPSIITAKIITIFKDEIQLQFEKPVIPAQSTNIITLKKEDILLGHKGVNSQTMESFNFKLGQKIYLTDISSGIDTDQKFKIISTTSEKLTKGQIINARVLKTNHNKTQLLLQPNYLSQKGLSSNNNNSPIITLNKNQLISEQTIGFKNTPFDIKNLQEGEVISFKVIKLGNQPKFELIDKNSLINTNLKIQDTIKQTLPAQNSPSELVNQLIKNLSSINDNASIPDNLKRLARQILDSIPHIKNDKVDPKILKQSVLNSGLFLEAKLTYSGKKNNLNLQADLKNQLLKLQHTIKQELETQQKSSSSEIDLLQEIQKKTENSLAKIILNQLASLPKEEGIKQAWVLDIPFINKEVSESVKIEIEREQNKDEETNSGNWAVTITITPPGLGTIHCKVTCINKTINTRFWSDTEKVVSMINHNLDYLKTQFDKAGIETGHMLAHSGTEKNDVINTLKNQSLFDQKV